MFKALHYGKWRDRLAQLLPDTCASRLLNMSYLIVGIFTSQSVYLSVIARSLPIDARKWSITKRLERFLDNDAVDVASWYHPWADWLLRSASVSGTIHLVVDTTKVSAYCRQLMIAVAYQRRTLPIIWDWIEHPRGHGSVEQQLSLLRRLYQLIPKGVEVSLVGDSEFGHPEVIALLKQWGWHYALRQQGRHLYRFGEDDWQRIDRIGIQPGQAVNFHHVYLTETHECLTNLVIYWKKGEKEPWYLATSESMVSATIRLYKRRVWIEEMFGDMKGHGFQLELSRLRTPERLSRLTLAICILYVWLVTMGEYVIEHGLQAEVDRKSRQDLSIFRTGWDWIKRRFALDKHIPILFRPNFCLVFGR
jgi:hypothetical protein